MQKYNTTTTTTTTVQILVFLMEKTRKQDGFRHKGTELD